MNEVTEIRNRSWAQMIKARQDSGLTIKQWCAENGINENSYYYRLNCLRKAALSQMPAVHKPAPPSGTVVQFGEVPVPEARPSTTISMRIRKKDSVIEISNDASEGILSLLREVLTHGD